MPSRPVDAALVVLALALPWCLGQTPDSKPASSQTKTAETRRIREARAVEIFARGVKAQTPDATFVIEDFQADLEVTFHEWDEKTKRTRPRSGALSEFYREVPAGRPFYRRDLFDALSDKRTIHGQNANMCWQKVGTSAGEELRGRDAQDQVKRIREEITRTQEFLKLLLLVKLDGPDVSLRTAGTATIKASGNSYEVERVMREKPGERPIALFFGIKDDRLYGFERAAEGDRPAETIAFSHHAPLKTGGTTIVVPLVVEYRENGALTLEARARDISSIKVNSNIRDEVFALPR